MQCIPQFSMGHNGCNTLIEIERQSNGSSDPINLNLRRGTDASCFTIYASNDQWTQDNIIINNLLK